MFETVSSIINYDIIGLSCLYATLMCLREAFVPKRRETLVYIIYVIKFTMDGLLTPTAVQLSALVRVLDFARSLSLTLLALKVAADIYSLSLVEGFVWLIVVNIPLSLVMGVSYQLGLALFERHPGTSYVTPLHVSTFVALALFAVQATLLKGPIAWVIKAVQRASKRFYVSYSTVLLLASVAFCISMYTVTKDFWTTDMRVLYWWLYPLVLVGVLPLGVFLFLNARKTRAQALLAEKCLALTASWGERIRKDYASIERDKALFDGLDEKLLRLEGCGSADYTGRVQQLNEEYERIAHGTYCSDVAIDAILSAHAARMQELGATAHISVAALASDVSKQASLLLSLLDAVATRAVWSRKAMGAELDLRLRPLHEGMLVHLDIPASWGRLGLRRVLREAGINGGTVAHERVENDRTVALILVEEVGACS